MGSVDQLALLPVPRTSNLDEVVQHFPQSFLLYDEIIATSLQPAMSLQQFHQSLHLPLTGTHCRETAHLNEPIYDLGLGSFDSHFGFLKTGGRSLPFYGIFSRFAAVAVERDSCVLRVSGADPG